MRARAYCRSSSPVMGGEAGGRVEAALLGEPVADLAAQPLDEAVIHRASPPRLIPRG